MNTITTLSAWSFLAPPLLMLVAAMFVQSQQISVTYAWKMFSGLAWLGLGFTLINLGMPILLPETANPTLPIRGIGTSALQVWMAILVQFLGTVIGIFSSRYLQGESHQRRFIGAFSLVLMFVHLLLLADHWLVMILSWASIGYALEKLLCFYPERPFAMLAAHKKFIADRLADAMLVIAASLAWWETGSGEISALFAYLTHNSPSLALQLSGIALVLAVVLRTALFPVHGWLIQVMEAPTPVSALLHAGVVNLSGFVLIHFSPLLNQIDYARWILVVSGLITALMAGLVMLTRVSIKVRLAWSTVAQMGFMLLECGLGLYTLAAMHLLGHSLYKAHAFLSASSAVEQAKLQRLTGQRNATLTSMLIAPGLAFAIILLMQLAFAYPTWPWWWSAILALAWAPLLWLPQHNRSALPIEISQSLLGMGMIAGLTLLATLLHRLPFGALDAPDQLAGEIALLGMLIMYFMLMIIQQSPQWLSILHRWSYAGFYVDESYTRLALRVWPIDWGKPIHGGNRPLNA